MKCPKCNFENKDTNLFCPNCKYNLTNKEETINNIELPKENNENTINIENTKVNTNEDNTMPKLILFFPTFFIYFILTAGAIYFIFGESYAMVSWVFALIAAPLISLVLAFITTFGLYDKEKEVTNINEEQNLNNTEKNTKNTSSKKKLNPLLKIIIVPILIPIFYIIIFYIIDFVEIIIESILGIEFPIEFLTFKIFGAAILGVIFSFAAVTEIPEENKNEKESNTKN